MKKLLFVLLLPITALAQGPSQPASQFLIVSFSSLGAQSNSSVRYCRDCNTGNPCTGGGTGAFAFRVGNAWNCVATFGGGGGGGGITNSAPANALMKSDGTNAVDSTGTVKISALTTNGIVTTTSGIGIVTVPSSLANVDGSGNLTANSLSTGSSPPTLTVGSGGAFGLKEGSAALAQASVGICYADSGSHAILCSFNNGSFFPMSRTIASGTAALGTGAINSATCASVVTSAGTGIATTDSIVWSFNADPTGVTGYIASANGMLTIIVYPTANTANFKVCNNTSSSITPGAITLNWAVVR